jgi:hypothetical protein
MILQHRQEQPITYEIVAEEQPSRVGKLYGIQHTLYSLVPTNFGSQPARNFICGGSKEYCLEVLSYLQNTDEA